MLVLAPGAGQAQSADLSPTPPPSEADVRFMEGMIVHHAQALEMTALVPERAEGADVRLLATRIDISQRDEMAVMRRWLENRAPVASGHDHHGDHDLMPGMLDAEGMARLRDATGKEFDRLFLESMIRHHEGALVMVAELFATDGAGQESEVYQFASHVDSDQRIEIARMRRMLGAR